MELDYYLVFQHQAFQRCSFLICEVGYKRRFGKDTEFMWCPWCVLFLKHLEYKWIALLEKTEVLKYLFFFFNKWDSNICLSSFIYLKHLLE